jgi:transposase
MRIDSLPDQQRVTNGLTESVIYLCSQVSTQLRIQHVAKFYRLHWDTVKCLDKHALKARLDSAGFSDVRVIGMDEFSLHKGKRYVTVVVDPLHNGALWVGPGRDRAAVRKQFFEQLGPEQCE